MEHIIPSIRIVSKDNINMVNGFLVLPYSKDLDYAIHFKKDKNIFKCYKGNIWVTTVCRKCNTYLCTDYSTISNHCLRKHKKEIFENNLRKNIIKFIILNNQYLSVVEDPDFNSLFPIQPISRRKIEITLNCIYNKEHIIKF